MRRAFLIIGLAVVLIGGVAVTAAQDVAFQDSPTENEEVGAPTGECATPSAQMDLAPDASPSLALASTPAGMVEASPTACATPEMGTPAS